MGQGLFFEEMYMWGKIVTAFCEFEHKLFSYLRRDHKSVKAKMRELE